MISFRFHVVSITAVFLAIAIGVVVGSTFVDRAIVDSLQDRIDGVSASLDERRAEIAGLEDELDRMEDYTEATAAFAVSGRLADQTLLPLALRGVDDTPVRRLVALAGQAGAATPGILWVEPRWQLDDDAAASELAAVVDQRTDSPEEARALAWSALLAELAGEAEEPVTPDTAGGTGLPQQPTTTATTAPAPVPEPTVLPALVEAGFLSFEPLTEGAVVADFVGTAPSVAVVTGPGADAEVRDRGAEVVSAVRDADLDVLVAELFEEPDGGDEDAPRRGDTAAAAVPEGAGTEVSVVDHLELRVGQVAAVLALADLRRDVVGHYGFGDGAAGVVPTWTPL